MKRSCKGRKYLAVMTLLVVGLLLYLERGALREGEIFWPAVGLVAAILAVLELLNFGYNTAGSPPDKHDGE